MSAEKSVPLGPVVSPSTTVHASPSNSFSEKHPPEYKPEPAAPSPATRRLSGLVRRMSSRPDADASSITSFERAVSRRSGIVDDPDWSLEKEIREITEQDERAGRPPRRLDVEWRDLCVRGVGADAVFADDLGTMMNPATKRRDKKRRQALESHTDRPDDGLADNEKYLLRNFNGVLRAGEMALVLGRPGAGCTTFMKAITNIRQGYAGVDGEVRYGTLESDKGAQRYPGQVVFVAEDEVFYPDLTVDQTIKFALKMRTPGKRARPEGVSRDEASEQLRQLLLKALAIEHTVDTKVGNESVRGVSGGERKRVTLAEALVNRAPVIAFDQPTRGLDASTALEFARSMRTIAKHQGNAVFMTAYQAGNALTECFDKILVIAAGRCIYWGPTADAGPYFERMGFKRAPGANLSDYLTAVTVATERIVEQGREVPTTAEEFERAYLESEVHERMAAERLDPGETERRTVDFEASVALEKARRSGKKSPYTSTLPTQIASATRRQFALTWNDKASLVIKLGGCILQSIVLGSLFYMLPDTTTGLFGKSGVLFLILLVNALLGLGEVVNSFKGRTVLAKHKGMALYHPAALIFAQVMVDIPVVALQVTVFVLPIYWMAGLRHTAGAFFTLWLFTYVSTHSLLGFFRMCGYAFSTFQASGAVSGLALGLIIVTTGYLIPPKQFKPWIGWFRWINPLYYALESAFINEFRGVTLPCTAPYLIPYGQGYPQTGNGVVCTVAGAVTGETFVTGDAYLAAQFGYKISHLWRNLGVIIAYWVLFLIVSCVSVSRLKAAGSTKSYLLFRRPKSLPAKDVETGSSSSASGGDADDMKIDRTETLFAWKNLKYTVPVRGGKRLLLDNVQGYTTPGSLVALMGASGAGKTTLLDVLGARKEEGEIEGEITVDGRPRGPSFQRTCGYVGQMDVHEPTQTIREAFLFSARLRQPRETPDEEIRAYVDKVIDVLELQDLADAVIGVPGAGLSIEQRKRTTIGVELVARPKLLFLDEPTSGLDGQSAFQILRFLKKLSAAGQSMLVTVHQPSALLFTQFDQLLLLAKGGRVVYNGPLGENASEMKKYFARHGATIEEEANPAEEMIDIVSGVRSKGHDWAQVWLDSDEHREMSRKVDEVIQEAAQKPPSFEEDGLYYAASLGTQMRLVLERSFSSVLRTPDYVLGRVGLVIGTGFITGVSFLQLSNDYRSVQNRLLVVFNAMFVAPPLFNIIQPRVIEQRTLYESREKQSKMFGWFPWVFALIITEIPWLLMSQILHWTVWYLITFPVGELTNPYHAGSFWFLDVLYFLWIGGFAQFIGVICPTAEAAALLNAVPLGLFAAFSGVLLPYPQMPVWWRYSLYYLDPWSYILGAKVFFVNWNVPIVCDPSELSTVQAPDGQTCGQYLGQFISQVAGYVTEPDATGSCQYCPYASGNEYLTTINENRSIIGWRNVGITALWVFAFWGFTIGAFAWRNRKA